MWSVGAAVTVSVPGAALVTDVTSLVYWRSQENGQGGQVRSTGREECSRGRAEEGMVKKIFKERLGKGVKEVSGKEDVDR